MLLAIDAGNTNIVIGMHDGNGWINHWRIRTVPDQMPDEYGLLLKGLLRDENFAPSDIRQIVISSVVPQLTGKLKEMAVRLTGNDPVIVGPGIKTGLKINTSNPSEVGTDLVCNAVAAYNRFKRPCIIIDFGTALTFTAVDGKGELLGVSIAPGLQAAAGALSAATAQLPQVWLEPPKTAIGKNTIHSIQSGILFGYAGLVEKVVDMMKAEMGGEATVIGTGGRVDTITPLTDRITVVEPWLILEGLRIIGDLNRK